MKAVKVAVQVLAGSTLLAKFSRLEAVFAVQYKLQSLQQQSHGNNISLSSKAEQAQGWANQSFPFAFYYR